MKKVFSLLLAVIVSVAMKAEDIIVTKDSKRINAKIEEVGLDIVKYRRSDNLTGPLYTIAKSNIASVIYENGSVEVFDSQSSNKKQEPQQQKAQSFILKTGPDFFLDGTKITKSEYANLLKNTCPEAYNQWKSGQRLFHASVGLLGFGATTIIIGLPLYLNSFGKIYYDGYYIYDHKWAAGIAMFAIGGAAIVTSVPLLTVGSVRTNNSADTYNTRCVDKTELSFNLTAGQNGIGLAINF